MKFYKILIALSLMANLALANDVKNNIQKDAKKQNDIWVEKSTNLPINGDWHQFYENGEIQAKTQWKNGRQDGIIQWYSKSGKLEQESTFTNGELNGISKLYYENGVLSAELEYKMGKQSGISKWFFKGGALREESNWVNGKREGEAKLYLNNAKLYASFVYKNGEPVEGNCMRERGYYGRSLNIAELTNWSKGVAVSCE